MFSLYNFTPKFHRCFEEDMALHKMHVNSSYGGRICRDTPEIGRGGLLKLFIASTLFAMFLSPFCSHCIVMQTYTHHLRSQPADFQGVMRSLRVNCSAARVQLCPSCTQCIVTGSGLPSTLIFPPPYSLLSLLIIFL